MSLAVHLAIRNRDTATNADMTKEARDARTHNDDLRKYVALTVKSLDSITATP